MTDVEATPDLRRLVEEAAAHPDPWFSALAKSHLAPQPADTDFDAALVTRLEDQAAAGHYERPEAETEDLEVPGPHGPVRVRIYRPEDARGPVLVWCHGGGFVGGDLDMPEADATAREMCTRADATVVSVDYRLATHGVHYPVPHDDVLAAYDWAVEALGRGAPCFIGGGSAGGNLAAGVALKLRDQDRSPAGALLLYPALHPVLPSPSEELAGKLALLSRAHSFSPESMRLTCENYLGAPLSEADGYAMPGIADLDGYPPTLVINCEYDGLRASGEAFTTALQAAGVTVQQLLALDVLHGHINSPWLAQAQQTYADMAAWLLATASALP